MLKINKGPGMLAYTFNPRRQADLCEFKATQSYISEILSKNRYGDLLSDISRKVRLGIN